MSADPYANIYQTDPMQQAVNPITPEPSKSKLPFIIGGLLIVVAIAVAAGAGIFFMTKSEDDKKSDDTEKSSESSKTSSQKSSKSSSESDISDQLSDYDKAFLEELGISEEEYEAELKAFLEETGVTLEELANMTDEELEEFFEEYVQKKIEEAQNQLEDENYSSQSFADQLDSKTKKKIEAAMEDPYKQDEKATAGLTSWEILEFEDLGETLGYLVDEEGNNLASDEGRCDSEKGSFYLIKFKTTNISNEDVYLTTDPTFIDADLNQYSPTDRTLLFCENKPDATNVGGGFLAGGESVETYWIIDAPADLDKLFLLVSDSDYFGGNLNESGEQYATFGF